MPLRDSLDKIVESYFAAITRQTFSYKNKTYQPRKLVVTHNLFRGFSCPSHCGACCPRFSLDYLPVEYPKHNSVQPVQRWVTFNNQQFEIYSDLQLDHENHHCRNLNMTDGRCNIHGQQPFSCDFELLRFELHKKSVIDARLSTHLFKRGRSNDGKKGMMRMDGVRGTKCEILPMNHTHSVQNQAEIVRKLKRLKQWADYFQLKHCLDFVIRWAEYGPHLSNLEISKDKLDGMFIKPLPNPNPLVVLQ